VSAFVLFSNWVPCLSPTRYTRTQTSRQGRLGHMRGLRLQYSVLVGTLAAVPGPAQVGKLQPSRIERDGKDGKANFSSVNAEVLSSLPTLPR
jgi:hypothetical protein